MSGLVDMWTNELAKLQQKGETTDSSTIQHECSQSQRLQEKEESSTGLAASVAKLMQVNKPRLMFSEASVSMFVECFSP